MTDANVDLLIPKQGTTSASDTFDVDSNYIEAVKDEEPNLGIFRAVPFLDTSKDSAIEVRADETFE